ncbi:MAG: hypothetical protein O7H41_00575 [Planctomycetota bacterium]|nr:hypothetical protein [Planctomycetota bacterium]
MPNRLAVSDIKTAVHAIQTRLNRASSVGENWLLYQSDPLDADQCEWYLRETWLLLVDLIERLDHGSFLEAAKTDREACLKDPLASEMGAHELFLTWVGRADSFLSMIEELHLPSETDEESGSDDNLLDVIRNSEYYIASRAIFGWVPCREEDVHQRIDGLLKCTYTDLRKNPPLSKPIKGFIPDSGIPSLKTALEYKFIQTEVEAKAAVDEILADIGGYQSDIYDTIIFVIYEVARLFSERDWNAAVKASKPRAEVRVVILRGPTPTKADREIRSKLRRKRKTGSKARGKGKPKRKET